MIRETSAQVLARLRVQGESGCVDSGCACHSRQVFLNRLEAIGTASRRGHAFVLKAVDDLSGLDFFSVADLSDSLIDALDQDLPGLELVFRTDPDPFELEARASRNVLTFPCRRTA